MQRGDKLGINSCLLPAVVLLLSVQPALLLLSPLVTVEEILAVVLEDNFGEVVKFLDWVVLDLLIKNKIIFTQLYV